MFTDEEFATRYLKALREVARNGKQFKWEHRAGETSATGVRMSAMGDCARRLYYKLTKQSITNHQEGSGSEWAQLMGFAGQEIVALTLRTMGYTIFDEEKEVEFNGSIGHIDGKITGLDLEDTVAIWDCKVRGSFSLYANDYGLITRGLPSADVSMYLQQNMYMAAEGLDMCMITAVPHDLGASRLEAVKRKITQPSFAINRIMLNRDIRAIELSLLRAKTIGTLVKSNLIPQPEYDPIKQKFPCGFCDHRELCIKDGHMGIKVPAIPDDWKR